MAGELPHQSQRDEPCGRAFTETGERIDVHAAYGDRALTALLIYDHATGVLKDGLSLNLGHVEQLYVALSRAMRSLGYSAGDLDAMIDRHG